MSADADRFSSEIRMGD